MEENRYTIGFSFLRAEDRERVGGKCASLGELVAAGLPVPAGFAVTVAAFEDFRDASTLRHELVDVVTGTRGAGPAELQSAHQRAAELILAGPLPPHIEDAIRGAYAQLSQTVAGARGTGGDSGIAVAVRSSAVDEDGDVASFAGQQETYLWVVGADEVVAKVRECWASLYTPQAIAYRSSMDAAQGAAASRIGVAIQAMAEADVAGVTFTVSPSTGDRSIIAINASYGLGQAVVSGEVTPDEYRVSKADFRIVSSRIAEKAHEYVPADDHRGVVLREVDAERRAAAALSDEEVQQVAAIGLRVEAHYGCPQDIEWALERRQGGEPAVMLLQSRPETSWKMRREEQKSAPVPGANLLGFLAGAIGEPRK
ncbi:MAG TPA: PEP/pyruvate-binding domain-containing protein [Microbacterium sp.]|uniref:PEP/pyruvate-binding domain-containing protein n=1 Tax=Microbacterium sp. TaxID=51671 RepID=UPI002CF5EB78|nr:PEP/pyruvate-binding domain-containing protein [Microbacterium sp.]HWI32491.1 PEP/pyruvate-binding domain-containing protein [Microbacterium sp.]